MPVAAPISDFEKIYVEHALRTIRLVQIFEDADLGIRPGDGSWSTAEQIEHICQNHNFVRGLLTEPHPTVELFQRRFLIRTVKEAVESLVKAVNEARAAFSAMTSERWDEEVEPFGPEWRKSRKVMLMSMINHETHHCGQLHVYARIAGKIPPVLYEPVDIKILELKNK